VIHIQTTRPSRFELTDKRGWIGHWSTDSLYIALILGCTDRSAPRRGGGAVERARRDLTRCGAVECSACAVDLARAGSWRHVSDFPSHRLYSSEHFGQPPLLLCYCFLKNTEPVFFEPILIR
jgi:hypothetical protein